MAETIRLSKEVLIELAKRKKFTEDSYEDIIWDLLEDDEELSEETQQNIAESMEDVRQGRVVSLEEMKKKYGM